MLRMGSIAGAIWLLIDLLRIWSPSLITIFGQAAATPPELMGAFAAGCVAASVIALLAVRWLPDRLVLRWCLALMLAARLILMFADGGGVQLWVSSAGVAAGIGAVTIMARLHGRILLAGLASGVAMAAVSHAFLGTWGAPWRSDVWGVLVTLVQAALVLRAMAAPPSGPASPRLAAALMPALLLAGIWAANPARAEAGWGTAGAVVVALAAVVGIGLARRGPRGLRWSVAGGAALAVGTAAAMLGPSLNGSLDQGGWPLLAYAVGMPALVLTLGGLEQRETWATGAASAGWAAWAGALAWVVVFFVYYAGYDLGYRADVAILVLALALAVFSAQASRHAVGLRARTGVRYLVAGGLVWLVVAVGPLLTVPQLRPAAAQAPAAAEGELRVLAYNVRMGYGMDGTFRPRDVARLIADQSPDVVMLSEVDRAWLLNGGQDQLGILARMLGMEAHFGPAADPVWGDAILTALPITQVSTQPLTQAGAPTGAQALAATVVKGGERFRLLSTHIQPNADDGSLTQARELAALAEAQGVDLLAGDLNLEPGEEAWHALVAGGPGLQDGLAEARPLLTSPADHPDQQIDHALVTEGVEASEARTLPSLLSDHLPIMVTIAHGDG